MLRFLFRRSLLFFVSLVVSLVLPFAWMNQDWKQGLSETYRQWTSQPSSSLNSWGGGDAEHAEAAHFESFRPTSLAASGLTTNNHVGTSHAWDAAAPMAIPVGTPATSAPVLPSVGIEEILRFDVTAQWITQRWPRVTNVTDDRWTGMRVPLVTGTRLGDVAGSLTYYFDTYGRVQRVSLSGTTGDASALVSLVMQQYGLVNEGGPGTGLYVARWNGQATSVLRVRQAPVIQVDSPQNRFELLLEINRPNYAYGLSAAVRQQLAHQLR